MLSDRRYPFLTPLPPSLPIFLLSFPTMDDDDNNLNTNYPLFQYNHQNPNYITATTLDSDIIHQDQNHRLPQWTQAETKSFLSVRAELDRSFSQTKRNKPLWEAVSLRMHQQGFTRTAEQCKSKWKNLVTRYKATDKQFTFHEEMRSILDNDGRKCKKVMKQRKRKRKEGEEIEEAIREFGRKQMEMEARWMEAAEGREADRRWKEEECRREMAALTEMNMETERRWRERDEERRAREEARDDRRHALITTIVTKIDGRQE